MKVKNGTIQKLMDELAEMQKQATMRAGSTYPKADLAELMKTSRELQNLREELRLAFENAKDAIFWADARTGIIINCNRSAECLLEKKREEIIGCPQVTLHPPQKANYYREVFKSDIARNASFDSEAEIITKSGRIISVHISTSVALVDGRKIIQGIFRDTTVHKEAEEALRESEEKYFAFFQQAGDSILTVNAETGEFFDFNDKACENLGYTREEFKNMRISDFEVDESPEEVKEHIEKVISQGGDIFEARHRTKNGEIRNILVNTQAITVHGQKLLHSIWRDITERKKVEQALKESEANYRSIFNTVNDMIVVHDIRTGEILGANQKMCQVLGYSVDELKRLDVGVFSLGKSPYSQKEAIQWIRKAAKGAPQLFEWMCKTKSGRIVWVEVNLKRATLGGKDCILAVVRGIDERKKAEEERETLNRELLRSNRKLQRLALRDPHTGLYNHRFFEEAVKAEFYRAKRYAQPLSLMLIDIDYFKSINDTYGHEFGDLVLKQFAKKIRKLVRLHDHVIRFGDEEFVILLPGVNRSGVLGLAQRLFESIRAFRFGNSENNTTLRLSVAVVSYPEDSIFKDQDFMKLADKVLDRVKESGGDRVYSSHELIKRGSADIERYEEITDVKCLKQRLEKVTKQVNQSLTESIFAFARAIELKDHYTGDHVEGTVTYATELARRLELNKSDIMLVRQASMLHDLGKIGISEKILLKKGKLTKKEFDKIKEHPKIGVDIIRPVQFLHGLIPLILYHHERWDGKGYPCGLKEREIPIGARIIAIADVYHALISDRPYRKALSKQKARRIIKENSSTQFDPLVVDVFLNILQEVRHVYRDG